MPTADAIATVIAAGGSQIPALMDRLETRLTELAASHGEVLAEHAGSTIAAGGKRLRPLLVFVAAGPPPGDAAWGPASAGRPRRLTPSAAASGTPSVAAA